MATSLSIADSAEAKRLPGVGDNNETDFHCGIGITVTVDPGQTILVEGDAAGCFYRVLSGTIRLYKSIADGRRQVIDFLGAGDVFGLTGGACHPYSVEAITPVTLVRHNRSRVEAAIAADPEVARQLFELACAELSRAQRQMLLLGRKSADERVATFLLRLVEADGGDPLVSVPPLVTLAMSRQDIADHLGLTIETVSRAFSRFRRAGWISLVGRQQVRIDQMARLCALADAESGAEYRPLPCSQNGAQGLRLAH
jgi:CRP/FNR family transcriptional regulator